MKTIGKPLAGVIAALVLCWIVKAHASPVDDLASPSQETRDAAAKILRETYIPPPRTNWDALVKALKVGAPQLIIEAQLRSSNFIVGGGMGSGNTEVKFYRLDDLWSLDCSFTNSTANITNSGLAYVTIREQLRNIWVEPPTNFSGVWRTFWVNGQPSHEFHYKDGQLEGLVITYYTDGSKCVVSPQHKGVPDGEETGFYPSGRIKYKGQQEAGRQAGTWIWYKEDGTIESKKDYGSK